jgi:hypothetical protein
MHFTAKIRGLPHNPSITEVNARSGPGTNHDVPLKAQVGQDGLIVLAVQPDENDTRFDGKLYQWFQLQFPDDQRAWVRDDLLAVIGDGVTFGYDNLTEETFAFALTRRDVLEPGEETSGPQPEPAPVPTPDATAQPHVAPTPAVPAGPAPETPAPSAALRSEDRVRHAAFNITEAFEGSGYASFQNFDSGIISYGRFQFTLAGSGLFSVLQKFTRDAHSSIAQELHASYLDRVRHHDPNLRHDPRLKQLLLEAANDPVMQAAQDATATENYWNVVQDLSIKPRNIQTPLGQALIFDMGINFGPRHGFIGAAEREIGVPPRSRLGENGGREEDLIAVLARLRKKSHDMQAERDNLPGLRFRGDFWVNLVNRGDWELVGNDDGRLEVKPGRRVQVRNF